MCVRDALKLTEGIALERETLVSQLEKLKYEHTHFLLVVVLDY